MKGIEVRLSKAIPKAGPRWSNGLSRTCPSCSDPVTQNGQGQKNPPFLKKFKNCKVHLHLDFITLQTFNINCLVPKGYISN
jgi:hypothetical protein